MAPHFAFCNNTRASSNILKSLNLSSCSFTFIYILSLFNLAACVNAASVIVTPGTDKITQAAVLASTGDELILQTGTYIETSTITTSKVLKIIGKTDNTSVIQFNSNIVPSLFQFNGGSQWNSSVSNLVLKDTATSKVCYVKEPKALNTSAPMDVYNATISGGMVHIATDLGVWMNTRAVQDVTLGTCVYRTVGSYLQGAVFSLHSATCHGRLAFRVAFDRLRSCGAEVDRTNPQFVAYKITLGAKWEETVTYRSQGKPLAHPVRRQVTAATIMRVQLDRVGQVNATIAVVHATPYQIQAVITALNRLDDNTTDIDVSLIMPFPFSLPVPSTGNVTGVDTLEPLGGITNWTTNGPACDGTKIGGACAQGLRFNVRGCQITGLYKLLDIWSKCQIHDSTGAILRSDYCPPPPDNGIGVAIHLDAEDFCLASSDSIGLFQATVSLWEDDTYTKKRTSTEFKLGQPMYASVDIKPGDSGIQVQKGQIVDFTRSDADNVTGSSNDTNCPTISTSGSNLTQGFQTGTDSTAMVTTAIGLTTELACAAPAARHQSNTATVYTEKDEQGYFQTITLGGLNTFSAIINQTKAVGVCVATAEIFTGPNYSGSSYILSSPQACDLYNLDGTTGPAVSIGSISVTPPLVQKLSLTSKMVTVSFPGGTSYGALSKTFDGSRQYATNRCWGTGMATNPTYVVNLGSFHAIDHLLISGGGADISGFLVSVDGVLCNSNGSNPTPTATYPTRVGCGDDAIGQTVTISVPYTADLALCEVEIWAQPLPSYKPTSNTPTTNTTTTQKWNATLQRPDYRCGPNYTIYGQPAVCSSSSSCCSPQGWCGTTADYCTCATCIKYVTTTVRRAAGGNGNGNGNANGKGATTKGFAKNGRVMSAIRFEFKIRVDYVDQRKVGRRRRRDLVVERIDRQSDPQLNDDTGKSGLAAAVSPKIGVGWSNTEYSKQKLWESGNIEGIEEEYDDREVVVVALGVSSGLLLLGCCSCTTVFLWVHVKLQQLKRKISNLKEARGHVSAANMINEIPKRKTSTGWQANNQSQLIAVPETQSTHGASGNHPPWRDSGNTLLRQNSITADPNMLSRTSIPNITPTTSIGSTCRNGSSGPHSLSRQPSYEFATATTSVYAGTGGRAAENGRRTSWIEYAV